MSGILHSQKDFYEFQKLLMSMVNKSDSEEPGDYTCRKVLFLIARYNHSRDITLRQMQLLLTIADHVIPFFVQHSGGLFIETLLKTDACELLRQKGINIVLETKFGHMDAIDHIYILFLEYLCLVLQRNNRYQQFHNSDIELFLKTANSIRAVDQTYAKYIPTKKLLMEEYHKFNHERLLTPQDELDIVQGRGRLGLMLFPNKAEWREELDKKGVEHIDIDGNMAVTAKSGIFANLEIDIDPHYEYYMNAHNIPIVRNNDKYLIASSDCDPLMNARYRDLTNLWPVVTYHVGDIPLKSQENEFKFPKEIHFCRAFDLDGRQFQPLRSAISI